MRPSLSIIIPTFNAGRCVRYAIESVIAQGYSSYEIIIIDGKSTDDTIHIVDEYMHYIAYFKSETDSGIYEAMNKGIEQCSGEWIFFLGADDILLPNVLSSINFDLNLDYKIIFGNVSYDSGGIFKSSLSWRTLYDNTVHHQSAFYRRNIFSDFRYDKNLKVASDYELNLILYLEKCKFKYVNKIIACCGSEGASSILSSTETNKVRSKYIKSHFLQGLLTSSLNFYYGYVNIKKMLKKVLICKR